MCFLWRGYLGWAECCGYDYVYLESIEGNKSLEYCQVEVIWSLRRARWLCVPGIMGVSEGFSS